MKGNVFYWTILNVVNIDNDKDMYTIRCLNLYIYTPFPLRQKTSSQ